MADLLPSEILSPGTLLGGRYVVEALIGHGGMAQVYRVEHETISRQMAVKVLSAEYSRDLAIVVRFMREAKAASKIRHENVVEITDFGETADGRPFMVMELLDGEDLSRTLSREGRLPWERARPMMLQILAALEAAHDQGVVHRDIKPENIFRITRMGNEDFLKVFDFGIAKILKDADDLTQSLTKQGEVMGTPSYMSPEMCSGERVDLRSDLYSFGMVAYQMLTGVLPFDDPDPSHVLYMHVSEPVPPMARVAPGLTVDRRTERIIQKALAKDREDRYQTAREVADALLADVDPEEPGLLNTLRSLFRRR